MKQNKASASGRKGKTKKTRPQGSVPPNSSLESLQPLEIPVETKLCGSGMAEFATVQSPVESFDTPNEFSLPTERNECPDSSAENLLQRTDHADSLVNNQILSSSNDTLYSVGEVDLDGIDDINLTHLPSPVQSPSKTPFRPLPSPFGSNPNTYVSSLSTRQPKPFSPFTIEEKQDDKLYSEHPLQTPHLPSSSPYPPSNKQPSVFFSTPQTHNTGLPMDRHTFFSSTLAAESDNISYSIDEQEQEMKQALNNYLQLVEERETKGAESPNARSHSKRHLSKTLPKKSSDSTSIVDLHFQKQTPSTISTQNNSKLCESSIPTASFLPKASTSLPFPSPSPEQYPSPSPATAVLETWEEVPKTEASFWSSFFAALSAVAFFLLYPFMELFNCFSVTAHLLRLGFRLWSIMAQTSHWIFMTIRLLIFVCFLCPNWARLLYEYFSLPSSHRGVQYGPNGRNSLDIYVPKHIQQRMEVEKARQEESNETPSSSLPSSSTPSGVRSPVVIFVPGGAWTIGFRVWAVLLGVHLSRNLTRIYSGPNESETVVKKRPSTKTRGNSKAKDDPSSINLRTKGPFNNSGSTNKPDLSAKGNGNGKENSNDKISLRSILGLVCHTVTSPFKAIFFAVHNWIKRPFDEINILAENAQKAIISSSSSADSTSTSTLDTTSALTSNPSPIRVADSIKDGVIMVSVDYRNFPQGNIYDMIIDVVVAFEWVIDNIDKYGGDVNNISICGQSAGAHILLLALLKGWDKVQNISMTSDMPSPFTPPISPFTSRNVILPQSSTPKSPSKTTTPTNGRAIAVTLSGTTSSALLDLPTRWVGVVKAIIGLSGPYNLLQAQDTFSERGLDPSVLSLIMAKPTDLRSLSPVHIANRTLCQRRRDSHPHANIEYFPKVYLIQGTSDKTVNPLGALQLANVLHKAGVEVVLDLWKQCSHTDLIIELPSLGYDPLAAHLQWIVKENAVMIKKRLDLNFAASSLNDEQSRSTSFATLRIDVPISTSRDIQSPVTREYEDRDQQSETSNRSSGSGSVSSTALLAEASAKPTGMETRRRRLSLHEPTKGEYFGSGHERDSSEFNSNLSSSPSSPLPSTSTTCGVDEGLFLLPPNPNSLLGRPRSKSDLNVSSINASGFRRHGGEKMSNISFVLNNIDEIFQPKDKEPRLIKDLHRLNDSFIRHVDMFEEMKYCVVGRQIVPEAVLMYARKMNPF